MTSASGRVTYRLMAAGAPHSPPSNVQLGWLQVQLLDDGRLRIEATAAPQSVGPAAAAIAPAGFTPKAEIYLR